MTQPNPIRRYKVTYWLFGSGQSPEEETMEVDTFDAKDAEHQASIEPRAYVQLNPSWIFQIKKIEPVEESPAG